MKATSPRIAAVTLAALLLNACAAIQSASCSPAEREAYEDAIAPIADRFGDALNEVRNADQSAIAGYLPLLQDIRQEALAVEAPGCVLGEYDTLITSMDSAIANVEEYLAEGPAPPSSDSAAVAETAPTAPQQYQTIPLEGRVANRLVEISGLAWLGDRLVLLPQHPFEEGGVLYTLEKADILAYLDQTTASPLSAQTIELVAPGLVESIRGYDGFEAIGFVGEQAYFTIEAEWDSGMVSHLVAGRFLPGQNEIVIDTGDLATITGQSLIPNAGDETLLISSSRVVTIHEINDPELVANPAAHVFDRSLASLDPIPFVPVQWRITDATALDADGHFWATNTSYFVLASEQLIEFQLTADGITRTSSAPIQLELESTSRNWEGIARLDERDGFLLVTDKDPETILAFVPKS
jgi:hypothetical protein